MTEPAMKITPAEIVKKLSLKPPSLNERVYLRAYGVEEMNIARTIRNHCEIVEKCGLVPEMATGSSGTVHLYAARRRSRNKHD